MAFHLRIWYSKCTQTGRPAPFSSREHMNVCGITVMEPVCGITVMAARVTVLWPCWKPWPRLSLRRHLHTGDLNAIHWGHMDAGSGTTWAQYSHLPHLQAFLSTLKALTLKTKQMAVRWTVGSGFLVFNLIRKFCVFSWECLLTYLVKAHEH